LPRRVQSHELANGINSVKHDTNAILALMKQQGKASVMQRARVSHPTSLTRSGGVGGISDRDSKGRFGKWTEPAADVIEAVRAMACQQAVEVATEARTALVNLSWNLPISFGQQGKGTNANASKPPIVADQVGALDVRFAIKRRQI
jgi:hypothetical protein